MCWKANPDTQSVELDNTLNITRIYLLLGPQGRQINNHVNFQLKVWLRGAVDKSQAWL